MCLARCLHHQKPTKLTYTNINVLAPIMSLQSGTATPALPKRSHDDDSAAGDAKRIKPEPAADILDDSQFGDLFDPLPFESKDGFPSSANFSMDDEKFTLPDLLGDGSELLAPTTSHMNSAGTSSSPPPPITGVNGPDRGAPRVANADINTNTPSHLLAGVPRVNSSSRLPDHLPLASTSATAPPHGPPMSTPMYQSASKLNLASFPYQRSTGPMGGPVGSASSTPGATGMVYPNQYRPPINSGYRPSNRFDPKRTFPPGMAIPGSSGAPAANKPDDPSKLNDALAAAGVDIQREEELLSSNYGRSALNLHQQQLANRQRQAYGPLNAFLHPYHVALFMNKVARENGVVQNFMVDPEMLDFMSAACKEWLSNIVTKTVSLSRHRRRGIPALNKNGQGKPKTIHPSQRSEVSKELRNLALRQKELEERRVAKRLVLGLEKSDEVAPETGNKAGAEETLHRAANATAAMMTMNPSRKKYSWMTSGGSSGGDEVKLNVSKDGGPKQSTLISTRGDNGLRFREIRTGNMITTKDLLTVLEEERMGTSKAVVKGYAKLKD